MTRRCKNPDCSSELSAASKCTDIIEKRGFCSIPCLTQHTRDKKAAAIAKRERQELRKAKERLKTRQDWIRDAQRWFNKWVRLRDECETCISCNRDHRGQYHAGHYRTTGACPELRFEPLNVHKQCSACNNHLSGNIVEYRINLVKKLGAETVEWLEGPHEPKKWTIEELREIKDKYRELCKQLQSQSKHKIIR